jgi:hypothetical protein
LPTLQYAPQNYRSCRQLSRARLLTTQAPDGQVEKSAFSEKRFPFWSGWRLWPWLTVQKGARRLVPQRAAERAPDCDFTQLIGQCPPFFALSIDVETAPAFLVNPIDEDGHNRLIIGFPNQFAGVDCVVLF